MCPGGSQLIETGLSWPSWVPCFFTRCILWSRTISGFGVLGPQLFTQLWPTILIHPFSPPSWFSFNKHLWHVGHMVLNVECESVSCSVVSDSLWPHELWLTRLLCLWNSPGKNTGVGSHTLLQGIFPTQGSNPGSPHCRQILYHLSHQGIPYKQDGDEQDIILACQAEKDLVRGILTRNPRFTVWRSQFCDRNTYRSSIRRKKTLGRREKLSQTFLCSSALLRLFWFWIISPSLQTTVT